MTVDEEQANDCPIASHRGWKESNSFAAASVPSAARSHESARRDQPPNHPSRAGYVASGSGIAGRPNMVSFKQVPRGLRQ